MWKLKADAGEAAKADNATAMKRRLEALRDIIPEIRRLEVGLTIKDSERAADAVLMAEFDSWADLAIYSAHPAHQEVVAFIRGIVSESRVVDYQA